MSTTTAVSRPADPGLDRLEAALAAWAGPGGAFDPAALADLDRRAEFPAAACTALDDFGLARYYVPATRGGSLAELGQLAGLLRAVAARDLTVAIAHGKTFLGAVSVWVSGTDEQAARLGAEIAGGAVVCWGLSERHHGSDLLAGELSAVATADGRWRLDGEKWLINNASRGDLLCVLARSDPDGGPRGFSLFLVDKRRLDAGSITYAPKVRTHGIRGADISGFLLNAAEVEAGALVGSVGGGVETVLKALQLTRTTCTALSLGAADHALPLVTDFVRERALYGQHLADLPVVRRGVGRMAAGLLLAEGTATLALRTVHTAPEELSVVSAIAKAFVPTVVQRALDEGSELLGARGFLTEEYACGAMQKLERDHQIVAIFDGSTPVNRHALITQFPVLAGTYRRPQPESVPLAAADLDTPLAALDPKRLRLLSREGCAAVRALPGAAAGAPPELAAAAQRLVGVADVLHEEIRRYKPRVRDTPTAAFRLAERYELVFAGAATLLLWLRNPRRHDQALWRSALWARACLALILDGLGEAGGDDEAFDELAGLVLAGAVTRPSLLTEI